MIRTGIGDWSRERAATSPHQVALIDDQRQCTYKDFEVRVDSIARALSVAGIGRYDRVGYLGPNRIELVEVFFAVCALGAVFVPLNYRLAPPEIAFILDDAEVQVLVRDVSCDDPVPYVSEPERIRTLAVGLGADGVEDLENFISDADGSVAGPINFVAGKDVFDDACMIQYTSGTTGTPKGVVLTHANVTWNCLNIIIDNDLSSRDVTLVGSPLIHTSALNATLMPTFLKSGKSVLLSKFEPGRALDAIADHGITFLSGVPAMFQAMRDNERWPTTDLGSVRMAVCAGAPAPSSLITEYRARHVPFVQGYGMTEAAPAVTMLRPGDATRKSGSSGRACFFTEVRVVDAGGDSVASGEIGEIQVRGPNVTPGYWNNPTATVSAFTEDGWFRTGDAGRLDLEGYLSVVDRFKDMFISGGENVYPAEVEHAILAHPAVAKCAVVGTPSERWGEVGRAFVVLDDGASVSLGELSDFLEDRLARYKHPKSLFVIDEMPLNASGKIAKRRLSSQLAVERFEIGGTDAVSRRGD